MPITARGGALLHVDSQESVANFRRDPWSVWTGIRKVPRSWAAKVALPFFLPGCFRACSEVRKIGLAISVKKDMHSRAFDTGLANKKRQTSDGVPFQVEMQCIEGHEFTVTVRFAHGEPSVVGSQGKGGDADLLHVDLPVQGGETFLTTA